MFTVEIIVCAFILSSPPAAAATTAAATATATTAATTAVGYQWAEVLYAGGAPGIVQGIIQVNVLIPAGVAAGAAVPVVLRVGDRASQPGITVVVK